MMMVESVQVHFSADQKTLMNFCLGIIMFGIALSITLEDFKRIIKFPKSVLIGITSEWLVMPILTVYLIHLFRPSPEVALGMIMVAACPGGPISNYMTQLSNGNAALSLTLTSVYTACCIIVTPYTFLGFSLFVPSTAHLITKFSLGLSDMLIPLVSILVVPVTLGIVINHFWPRLANKIIKPVKQVSLLILIAFILVAILGNPEALVKSISTVFLMVIVQNAVGMAAGYYWAKWHRLPLRDRKAISFETGIHNSGLGLVLAYRYFDSLQDMILVIGVWAFWDMISSLVVATYWSKRKST